MAGKRRRKPVKQDIHRSVANKRGDRELTLHWLLHRVTTHEACHGGQAARLARMHKTDFASATDRKSRQS